MVIKILKKFNTPPKLRFATLHFAWGEKIPFTQNLIHYLFFPLGSFLLALLGKIDPGLSILALVYAYFIIIHLALNIKCPNCGEKIGMQRNRWKKGKVRITYSPTLYTPKKCVYCNFVLKE